MENILSHYIPNISFDVQSLQKIEGDLERKRRDSGGDGPPTEIGLDELEDLAIDDEDFSIRELPDNTAQYSGEYSYLNFSLKIRRKIDEWMHNAAPEDLQDPVPFEERWRATQLQSGSALVSAATTCLPPRYVADFLVQTFFNYAQTNNYYVEEDWLRDELHTCYMSPASLSSGDAASVCAILMVLAIGTQFAHMDSPTPTNRTLLDSLSTEDHRFSEDEVGLTFYQFASKLLPDIIATASVRSVQACLLVGTYLLPLDTSGLSYTYFGLALKMAIQNGMHRRYAGESLDPHTVEIRNRVFWTAYTIEKRISILHGRPASITNADVDAGVPLDLPSLRPPGQLTNYTNMVALIVLTLKLGEIADEISMLRRCRKGHQPECLEKLLAQRKQLTEWWATLPEETYCRDLSPTGGLFRANVHLKLDFCLTRIFIGRPFLFSTMKGINQALTTGPPLKATNSRPRSSSILIADCVEAALEIVDLCRLLRDETGLARASYTEFSSCRAALLVILAQSLTKRTERLRNALAQGMKLIKIMSTSIGSARAAVSVIEALERAIRRLETWSETQPQNQADIIDSGYERFKSWEMLWKTGPMSPLTATLSSQTIVAGSKAPTGPADTGNTRLNIDTRGTTLAGPHFATSPTVSHMPHFGFDSFISNFPLELDEFTAIPCFENNEAQQGLSADIRGHVDGDPQWMQL